MARDFSPVAVTFTVEAELDGAGEGWTDITRDVRISKPVRWSYGITGSGPLDRVASTGTLTFALDNSSANSGAKVGYYSPGHLFARSGFDVGISVRIGLSYDGITTLKKYRLDHVRPVAGINDERVAICDAVDWMDEAARYKLSGIAIQLNKRSDQIFSTIVSDITRQPENQSVATGQDTFEYALDNLKDEHETAMSAFQKLCQSELGQIFVRRDATKGETLVFEDRHARVKNSVSDAIFVNDTSALEVSRSRDQLLNIVRVVTHMRRVDDAATTVLYSLGDAAPKVDPSDSIFPFGPYRDPTQEAARVGGTEMVTPASTTDFLMNTSADGTGSNITSSFTCTAVFGANGVQWTITNNGAVTGYVTKLQCRGKGVYDYSRAILTANDSSSQTSFGDNVLTMDMSYQTDANIGQLSADYLLHLYKDLLTYVPTMSYIANRNDFLMTQAIQLDISDRIGVTEDVSGLESIIAGSSATVGYFINGVGYEIQNGHLLKVTYTLAPADTSAYWILDQIGASEIGVSTRLAFA